MDLDDNIRASRRINRVGGWVLVIAALLAMFILPVFAPGFGEYLMPVHGF